MRHTAVLEGLIQGAVAAGADDAIVVPYIPPGLSEPADGIAAMLINGRGGRKWLVALKEHPSGWAARFFTSRGGKRLTPVMRTREAGKEWGRLFAKDAADFGHLTNYGDPTANPGVRRISERGLVNALARVSEHAETSEEILAMLTEHLPGFVSADFTSDVEYRMNHRAPGRTAYVIAGSEEDGNLPYIEYADPW